VVVLRMPRKIPSYQLALFSKATMSKAMRSVMLIDII
jgi:hypothetical protein